MLCVGTSHLSIDLCALLSPPLSSFVMQGYLLYIHNRTLAVTRILGQRCISESGFLHLYYKCFLQSMFQTTC